MACPDEVSVHNAAREHKLRSYAASIVEAVMPVWLGERLHNGRLCVRLRGVQESVSSSKWSTVMNFFETPSRRLAYVKAAGMFVLAVVFLVFPLLVDADSTGRMFGYILAGICFLGGLYNVWRARRTPKDEVTIPFERSPASVKLRFCRRMLWITPPTFAALTCSVASDLYRLESGEAQRVWIHEPFALIYQHFGYWPAVISVPVLGLALWFVFAHQAKKLRREVGDDDS
jgi:hypothetical protein